MEKFYLFCACFFNVLAVLYAAGNATSSCLEREKTLALLETAENFLTKARDSYPSRKKSTNSTNPCDNEKSLAYFEISRKLIADVRENFPSCLNPIIDNDEDETKDDINDENFGDCSEILASGRNKSGVYKIWLGKDLSTERHQLVYCDMETDGGGWTVIQRRGKFPVQQDFKLDWESYKIGFGNLTEEFWLGNENIRILCLKGCTIRFDLMDQRGDERYAVYKKFSLASNDYRLNVSDFSGNAGDSLQIHNKYEFSTKDKGNTLLAKQYQSGWWHRGNHETNLNGVYHPGKRGSEYVFWIAVDGYDNLAAVEMKVKPN